MTEIVFVVPVDAGETYTDWIRSVGSSAGARTTRVTDAATATILGYGLPAEPERTIGRMLCETLHELGHTFGLIHCLDPACCMALATNIQQLDAKESEYCPGCSAVLAQLLKPERAELR